VLASHEATALALMSFVEEKLAPLQIDTTRDRLVSACLSVVPELSIEPTQSAMWPSIGRFS
jgi:hypothetical protein